VIETELPIAITCGEILLMVGVSAALVTVKEPLDAAEPPGAVTAIVPSLPRGNNGNQLGGEAEDTTAVVPLNVTVF